VLARVDGRPDGTIRVVPIQEKDAPVTEPNEWDE
jgi:hypothetical protein